MYKEIEIKNFLGFRDFKIDNLGFFNLIAGKNSAGKTAFLEAIFLHAGESNPEFLLKMVSMRMKGVLKWDVRSYSEFPLDFLFNGFDISRKIEIRSRSVEDEERLSSFRVLRQSEDLQGLSKVLFPEDLVASSTMSSFETDKFLRLDYQSGNNRRKTYLRFSNRGVSISPQPPPPSFPVYIILDSNNAEAIEFAGRFGDLETQGRKHELLEIMQIIEPRLKNLTIIVRPDKPVLFADIGLPQMVALPFSGGGLVRIAYIAMMLLLHKNGVVLFDEMENGLHYSILEDIWGAIATAAKRNNIQLFATTHSLECIQAARRAFQRVAPQDFRYYRLGRKNEDVIAVSYSNEGLERADELDYEVR